MSLTSVLPLTSFSIEQLVTIALLIFARVGACLMLMPGMSSVRIPMSLRLFIGISFSLAILPLVTESFKVLGDKPNLALLVRALFAEMLIGSTFGVIAHAYLWALQFMASIIGMSIGFSGQPGHSIIESTPESHVANILVFAAVILFFASDLHIITIQGLLTSYDIVPLAFIPNPEAALTDYHEALSRAFLTTLSIAAPFIIYAILINITIGLLNKLTPTIPVYFISLPFVMCGGLFLLYILMPELLHLFNSELRDWLKKGS
ncbi:MULTISPECIES: flagellar biosynthetic protein FliR [Bartonella]|uniref:Flagellar biosynthetic protein FliR n=1 Tax=Bartonella rochalimae ATCC BAA-1498 TaxID=685782 RepID=E6YKZ1_9HYPH|nr:MULTISPECIES: flagellar biosynthetic protein FliR [Bartonella]AQX18635.1 flagellar biosynthetic protein FliR [Bartonella sp. A1379B]AQX23149.1 flagellar biosynthetic protein FliR [Bartonella sp. 11B]AQX23552.1 flagellar biosynthetic protein FliR [Bartonella sp. 114]AQX25604.1 flagellar biosynthetic protein FliR [Bartonella sp. Coyote22sub2]AQX26902.1 flagellar biosynthetic protein FliR [Bartonella sp. Raccoon60]